MRNLLAMWLFSLALVALYFNGGELLTDPVEERYFLESSLSSIPLVSQTIDKLPDSLKLTEIDGELQVDEEGNLRISPQIKNLFDYFLMTLGEEDLDQILARINTYLSSELKEPTLSQARQVLSQYIKYKHEMYELTQSYNDQAGFMGGEFETLQRQLDMQYRIRREVMQPETVQAFFEFDEIYDQWSLDRLKVGADDSLTLEEKTLKLSEMDEQLPEEMRALTKKNQQHEKFRQLQNSQTFDSDEEKYAFYQQQAGEEAAQRLQTLDADRQQWQARLDQYFLLKKQIMQTQGMDSSDLRNYLDELKSTSFTEREQRRLSAIEAMIGDNG